MKSQAYADASLDTVDIALKAVCGRPYFIRFNSHLALADLQQVGWDEMTVETARQAQRVVEAECAWLEGYGAPPAFTADYSKCVLQGASFVLRGLALDERTPYAQSGAVRRERGVGVPENLNLYFKFSRKSALFWPDMPLFHSLPGSSYYGQFKTKLWPALPQQVQVHTLGAWHNVKKQELERQTPLSKQEVGFRRRVKCV